MKDLSRGDATVLSPLPPSDRTADLAAKPPDGNNAPRPPQVHLRPAVDRVYPLAEARAALERLERGEQLGKIVVQVAD